MHGLVNRAIERFVTDSYGRDKWNAISRAADLLVPSFEPMMTYEDDITLRVLDATCKVLGHTRADLLEDFGTYLVSHRNMETVRRLLRFGGVSFVEFLHSLDELPDRVRMAVPDLVLPRIELREWTASDFALICDAPLEGYGHLMIGLLRSLADDYGALAVLTHEGRAGHIESIAVSLVETEFSEGRRFELGARAL